MDLVLNDLRKPKKPTNQQTIKPFNCVQTNELWLISNVIYKLFVCKSYIFNVCMNKIWHQITYKGWYTLKPNQHTHQLCYYVHFWINIFGKGMNSLILSAKD